MGHDWRDRPCLLPSLETRAPRKWNINQPTTKHRQTVRTPRDETIWTNHKFSLMSEWQRSELADRFLLIGRTVAHYSQTEIQHLLYLYFFSGYRLVNPCLGRGQLSNIQKASNAVIMNIKTEYEDEILFLKTVTAVYMYSCITKFAEN